MRHRHVVSLVAAVPLIVAGGACGGSAPGSRTTAGSEAPATPATSASEQPFEVLDPGNFDHPTTIDNEWLPLEPGTRYVYEGTTIDDEGAAVPHRVVINVTDLTKVIGGVRTLITWDLDYSDGELVEAELAHWAQDRDGTVWHLGQYPEEYEAGKFVAAPAWIHGFEDARAGIAMKAEPRLGTRSYSQGWGPAVSWTDRGQVDQMGQASCVPAGCYEDVLVIAETSREEPGAHQLKYYARGVGNIRVGWRGAGETTKETLELQKVERLDSAAMAEVRAKAREQERQGNQRSPSVYARTPPAERALAAATGR